MYGIATKQAKNKIEDMNKDKLKELIQQSLEGKKDKKPLPKPVAKDLNKIKTNFPSLSSICWPSTYTHKQLNTKCVIEKCINIGVISLHHSLPIIYVSLKVLNIRYFE